MSATPTNGVTRGAGKRKPLMLAADLVPVAPKPPRYLTANGRLWWASIWSGGARWLDPASDLLIVELICNAVGQADEIEADLKKLGRYYKSPQGHELPRPGVGDSRALRAQMVSWLALLGFSPGQRADMGANVQVPNSLSLFRQRSAHLDVT